MPVDLRLAKLRAIYAAGKFYKCPVPNCETVEASAGTCTTHVRQTLIAEELSAREKNELGKCMVAVCVVNVLNTRLQRVFRAMERNFKNMAHAH